jgi:Na+-translocating ferredoxin:NAD+ oxidoreductase RnfD subunit
LGVAFASAVFYLALVAWRYRPISDPNTLRRVLSGAKYFGAVAGNPIAEKSL